MSALSVLTHTLVPAAARLAPGVMTMPFRAGDRRDARRHHRARREHGIRRPRNGDRRTGPDALLECCVLAHGFPRPLRDATMKPPLL